MKTSEPIIINNETIETVTAIAASWIRFHNSRIELQELVNAAVLVLLQGKVKVDGCLLFAVQKGAATIPQMNAGPENYDAGQVPEVCTDNVDRIIDSIVDKEDRLVFRMFFDSTNVRDISYVTGHTVDWIKDSLSRSRIFLGGTEYDN